MTTAEALQYQNRKGVVFYLQQGKTPTGKAKYYAGRKLTGTPLAAMPDGNDFYERPDNAQVVLRKVKPSPITEFERKQVEEIVRRASGLAHFIVEIDGNAIVVHTPSTTTGHVVDLFKEIAGPFFDPASAIARELRENLFKRSLYLKMLRFVLVDPDKRQFWAGRWCVDGSIGEWIALPGCGSLALVVEPYAKHLGR